MNRRTTLFGHFPDHHYPLIARMVWLSERNRKNPAFKVRKLKLGGVCSTSETLYGMRRLLESNASHPLSCSQTEDQALAAV